MDNFLSWHLGTFGVEKTLIKAAELLEKERAQLNALWESRFFVQRTLDDGTKKLWPTTAQAISNAVDTQDLIDEPLEQYFYCDDDGQLYPVTFGANVMELPDDERAALYGFGDMIANGKIVGTVIYTDH